MELSYTVLTMVGTDDPWRGWYRLREAIEASGFTITAQRSAFGFLKSTDSEPPLEVVVEINHPEVRERLQEAKVVLSHVIAMQFRKARELLLAQPYDDAGDFYNLCRTLAQLGLGFADLSAEQMICWQGEDWKPYGVNGHTGNTLVRLGILGPAMLRAFTPDELGSMYDIGHGKRYESIMALRTRLLSSK